MFVHIVGISVVCCYAHDSAGFLNCLPYPAQLQVHGLHGADHSVEDTGVPHHVAVGEIEPYMLIFAALYGINHCIGNLGTLHPRPLLERNHIALNLYIIL